MLIWRKALVIKCHVYHDRTATISAPYVHAPDMSRYPMPDSKLQMPDTAIDGVRPTDEQRHEWCLCRTCVFSVPEGEDHGITASTP
jgi:hypothetical protein